MHVFSFVNSPCINVGGRKKLGENTPGRESNRAITVDSALHESIYALSAQTRPLRKKFEERRATRDWTGDGDLGRRLTNHRVSLISKYDSHLHAIPTRVNFASDRDIKANEVSCNRDYTPNFFHEFFKPIYIYKYVYIYIHAYTYNR